MCVVFFPHVARNLEQSVTFCLCLLSNMRFVKLNLTGRHQCQVLIKIQLR